MRVDISFKDKYIEPILQGTKKTTWRVGSETMLKPEETVSLIDGSRNEFAIAQVDWCKRTQIRFMVAEDFKWHGGPETAVQVKRRLQELYPEHHVTASTDIIVIRFRVKKDLT